jgi:hypothetical protein
MTHTFKVILLSALVSGLPFISQAAEKTDSARIDPGKVHEVCFAMEFGERLTYAFMSSRDMKFNIHYHEGDDVSFPVEEHLTAEEEDIFTAMSSQGYCMMWTNPSNRIVPLNVVYRVR